MPPVRLLAFSASTLGVALMAGGCGSAGTPGGSDSGVSRGSVSVLYAGSLAGIMEDDLGPAFARATGYGYQGYGAGSTELVAQIEGRVRTGDVFISASSSADQSLEGAANGGHVSWYAAFARAPLVIGYDPSSRFASDFRSEPWYRVVTQAGIEVGRTDPALDPKGALTVSAVQQAATALGMPSLDRALSGWQVFPEETLVGRLESGQLDAGFFYSFEAAAQHLPTVSLSPATRSATLTVTVLDGAPDPAGAAAFVGYLLGPSGERVLRSQGMVLLTPPSVTGPASSVPASLRSLFGGA